MVPAGDQDDLPAGLVQPGADAAPDRSGADDHVARHGPRYTVPGRCPTARTRLAACRPRLVFALLLVAGVAVIGLVAAVLAGPPAAAVARPGANG